jgi:hypothetical protein
MSNTICLPTEHYTFMMIFFIGITIFYIYKIQTVDFNFGLNNNINNLSKQMDILDDVPIIYRKPEVYKRKGRDDPVENTSSSLIVTDFAKRQLLERRDKDAIYNEFKAPEKRLPEYAYPNRYVRSMINIPTRGTPDNFHAIGTLIRKNDEKVLQLFGRQTYPGSNQWEYYVSGADTYGFPNKMPIQVRGNREIENNQMIALPFLDTKKGEFQANIYNYDVPRYNPYDY